jgi:AcrR family transcriptional regulator
LKSNKVGQSKKPNHALALQEAAKDLFLTKGIESTPMRTISKAAGCSVGTVYLYYKDKNDILHHLHAEGFKRLSAKMEEMPQFATAQASLLALGKVYIDFAIENQDMYDLMFSLKGPIAFEESQGEEWGEGKATFKILHQTVEQCIAEGHFKGHEANSLSMVFWAAVHGLCALHHSGRIKNLQERQPRQVVDEAYKALALLIVNN